MKPSIGWSGFAVQRHFLHPRTGHSYTHLPLSEVIILVEANWDKRTPGQGETGLDRKVVVPIENFPPCAFYLPLVKLEDIPIGTKLEAEVVARQEGEQPYIETFLTYAQVDELRLNIVEPKYINIVCYSAEALLENGGRRTRLDYDWEIVCLLCSEDEQEPMRPLTMARNYLEKPGGTKTYYEPSEFAKAIWYHSTKGRVKVK